IVIGASGLMCCSHLNNKNVLLIDKNSMIGKNLSITGIGRFNLLNLKSFTHFINHIGIKD
ncbi:MAG: hypothetical protein ACK5HL_03310, partial [Bacilli bacterium]